MKRYLLALLAAVAVIALPMTANADLFSGFSVTNAQIAATDGWASGTGTEGGGTAAQEGFKISWLVTANGGAFPVHYHYAITNDADGNLSKGLSHIILQISNDATLADFLFGTTPAINDPRTYDSTSDGNSNPNMPNPIYGFKFSANGATTFSIDFDSTRMPTWGNFYADDGTDTQGTIKVTAWNVGLQTDPTHPSDNGLYISVPDTATVPLPGALLLLGGGLVRLAAYGRKRRQAAA